MFEYEGTMHFKSVSMSLCKQTSMRNRHMGAQRKLADECEDLRNENKLLSERSRRVMQQIHKRDKPVHFFVSSHLLLPAAASCVLLPSCTLPCPRRAYRYVSKLEADLTAQSRESQLVRHQLDLKVPASLEQALASPTRTYQSITDHPRRHHKSSKTGSILNCLSGKQRLHLPHWLGSCFGRERSWQNCN